MIDRERAKGIARSVERIVSRYSRERERERRFERNHRRIVRACSCDSCRTCGKGANGHAAGRSKARACGVCSRKSARMRAFLDEPGDNGRELDGSMSAGKGRTREGKSNDA